MTFQEFISIVISTSLLLLWICRVYQSLTQVTQLRIRQLSSRTTLWRNTILQSWSQQCRTEPILRVLVCHVTYFMTDYTQQFIIRHDIHQRRENAHTTVSTSKCIDIYHIINFEVQRNSLHIRQTFSQLFQTNCILIIVGTYLIMCIHPVDILFYIFCHLSISQSNSFNSFSRTFQCFYIKLSHCRHCHGHT